MLRSAGDAAKIVELAASSGIYTSQELVNRAIRLGKCNDALFRVIASFFKQKEKLIKSYLK
jgi:hypothetical protein